MYMKLSSILFFIFNYSKNCHRIKQVNLGHLGHFFSKVRNLVALTFRW